MAKVSEPLPASAAHRRALMAILLAAVVLRLVPAFVAIQNPDKAFVRDSDDYALTAESIWRDGSFSTQGRPELLRTPGYPLFLCAFKPLGEHYWQAAILAQVVLDTLVVYLACILGRLLISEKAGLYAAGLQAISTAAIVSSVIVMSDTLFALLLTAAVFCLVKHYKTLSPKWLAAAATLTAAATYVRPVGIIFIPVAGLTLLMQKRQMVRLALLCGIFVLLAGPWVIRNYIQAGYPKFSSAGDINLLISEAAGVLAEVEQTSMPAASRKLEQRLSASSDGITPRTAAHARLQADIARSVLHEHWPTWIAVHARTSLNCLMPAGSGLLELFGVTSGSRGTLGVLQRNGVMAAVDHYFQHSRWAICLLLPDVLVTLLKYLFVLVAVWAVLRKVWMMGPLAGSSRFSFSLSSWACAVLLATLTIAAFVMVAGPVASSRFRLAAEPLLNVFGAAGIAAAIELYSRRRASGKPAKPAEPAAAPVPAAKQPSRAIKKLS